MSKSIALRGQKSAKTLPAPTLSDTYIKSLPQNRERNTYYPIKGYKGLNIQVTKAGAKVYLVRYRVNGKQRMYTMGTYPSLKPAAAGDEFHKVYAKIAAGIDPNQEKVVARKISTVALQKAYLVKDLARDFVEGYVKKNLKPSSEKETIRYINKYIIPKIGEISVEDVTAPQIEAMIDDLSATPVQANRLKAAASKMFNWGILKGRRPLGSNPVSVVPKKPTNEPRTVRLSEVQVANVGKVLIDSNEIEIAKKAISLYLHTGMRKSELIGDKARSIQALTWDRVDIENGTLLVYTKVRKSAKAQLRTIFCSRAVIEILKSIPKIEGNPYVITGRLKNSSFVGIQDVWQRVRKEAGLEPEGKKDIDPPSIHDLRRTYASIVHDLGYKAYASDLLGHKVKNPTDIYTRSEIIRLMKVAELAGRRINGLLGGTVKPLGYKLPETNSPKSKKVSQPKQRAEQS